MNKNQIKLVITICTIFIVFFPIRSNAKIVVNKYGAYDTYYPWTSTLPNPFTQQEETHNYKGTRIWSGGHFDESGVEYPSSVIPVSYEVTYCYDEAYKMIDLVNDFRKSEGKEPVVVNDVMMEIAMERAAQVALFFSHDRPDTLSNSATGFFINGENIALGMREAEGNINLWKKSDGHRKNMLSNSWKYAGYGIVRIKAANDDFEQTIAVQIFTPMKGGYAPKLENGDVVKGEHIDLATTPLTHLQDYKECYTADLNPEYLNYVGAYIRQEENVSPDNHSNWCTHNPINKDAKDVLSSDMTEASVIQCEIGDLFSYRAGVIVQYERYYTGSGVYGKTDVQLSADQYSLSSSDTSVCKIENGKITPVGEGTATITFIWLQNPQYTSSFVMRVGGVETFKDAKGITYETVDKKEGERKAVITAVSDNVKSVAIPESVKINGWTYKVTAIAPKAFYNHKKLTRVTIGSNVTEIGKQAFYKCTGMQSVIIGKNVKTIGSEAFYGCKKLKKITSYSGALKKVGKNAIKGVSKKLVIRVPRSKKKVMQRVKENGYARMVYRRPASKLKKYRKLFKKSTGFKKSMKIKE